MDVLYEIAQSVAGLGFAGLAVPPEVRSHYVVVASEILGNSCPAEAVIGPPMDQ